MSKTNTLEKYFFLTWQVTTTSQCLNALHNAYFNFILKICQRQPQWSATTYTQRKIDVINWLAELMFASVSEHCYSKKSGIISAAGNRIFSTPTIPLHSAQTVTQSVATWKALENSPLPLGRNTTAKWIL